MEPTNTHTRHATIIPYQCSFHWRLALLTFIPVLFHGVWYTVSHDDQQCYFRARHQVVAFAARKVLHCAACTGHVVQRRVAAYRTSRDAQSSCDAIEVDGANAGAAE